jgi:MFS family permease
MAESNMLPENGDEAPSLPFISIRHVFPYLGFSLCLALLGIGMMSPMLPIYAASLGVSGTGIGIILGSFSLSRAILTPVFGWLSDRKGRKVFLEVGLGSAGLFSFAYLLSNSFPSLITVRLLHGGAAALVIPLIMAYTGDLIPKGEEGKWMGYLNTLMLVGMGAGPLLGGAVSDLAGPSAVFIVMGALYLLGFCSILIFLPESHPPVTLKAPHPTVKKMSASHLFWGLLIFWMVIEMSLAIVFAFLPLEGTRRLGLSAFEIGLLIAINTGIMALAQSFTGKLADRIDRRWLAAAGSLLHYVSMGCIVFAGSFWNMALIMALSGAGFALAMPAVSALIVEEGRLYGMGTTNGWIIVGRAAGVATGPVLAGLVNDNLGMPAVFVLAGAIGMPAVATTLWLLRSKRPSEATT